MHLKFLWKSAAKSAAVIPPLNMSTTFFLRTKWRCRLELKENLGLGLDKEARKKACSQLHALLSGPAQLGLSWKVSSETSFWRISKTFCGWNPSRERSNRNKEPSPSVSPSVFGQMMNTTVPCWQKKKTFFPWKVGKRMGIHSFFWLCFFFFHLVVQRLTYSHVVHDVLFFSLQIFTVPEE